jgi:hypothetical protein
MQEIEKVLKRYGWRLKSACGGYYPEQKKDELTITISRKDGGVVGMGAVAQFI